MLSADKRRLAENFKSNREASIDAKAGFLRKVLESHLCD